MESGIGISNPLFFIGVIEDNNDPRLEGRVRVRAFSVHGTSDQIKPHELPWAICAAGNYDPNNLPPALNSFVYGMFLDGRDAQHPLVLGLIPQQMTEAADPIKYGWGVVPEFDGTINAKGSAPRDIGNPQNSRLARGENLEETYILPQEMNRVEDAKVAGTDEKWSEPNSAYAAKYPYNRVIETSKHSVEIDDTPGAERIMIHHGAGSFVQMDSTGTTTYKSSKDHYTVTGGNEHLHVRGRSVVHIHGDSHVYTHGNKTEEVNGNYKLQVHGSAEFSIANQLNLNAGTQIQARATDVKIEANAGQVTVKAATAVHIEGLENLILNSDYINISADGSDKSDVDIFASGSLNSTAVFDHSLSASNISIRASASSSASEVSAGLNLHSNSVMNISASGTLDIQAIGAATLNGSTVAIADGSPSVSQPSYSITTPTFGVSKIKMPEPTSMSVSAPIGQKYSSGSAVGIISASDEITKKKVP